MSKNQTRSLTFADFLVSLLVFIGISQLRFVYGTTSATLQEITKYCASVFEFQTLSVGSLLRISCSIEKDICKLKKTVC